MDYPLQSVTNCQTHLVQVNQEFPSKESLYCNLIYRNGLFWSWLLPPSHVIFMTVSSSLKKKKKTILSSPGGEESTRLLTKPQPLCAFYRLSISLSLNG